MERLIPRVKRARYIPDSHERADAGPWHAHRGGGMEGVLRAVSSRRSTTPREGHRRRAGLPQSHAHGRARESVRPVDRRLQSAPLRSPVRRPDKVGELVVQGGLTTGLLHALVAMDLPGPGTVFLSQNWKFTAPVYIGDTITAEAEIVSVQ